MLPAEMLSGWLTTIRKISDPVFSTTVTIMVTELSGQGREISRFSPRHVCDEIGIAWPPQYTKLKAAPIFSEGVTMIVTPSDGGMQ